MHLTTMNKKFLIALVFFSNLAKNSNSFAIESINQNLIPKPEAKLTILKEQEIRNHLIDRSFDRPNKCPLRANPDLWGLHSRLSVIADSLKYGECYNRNKNTIEGFERLLSEKDEFFPAFNMNRNNNADINPQINPGMNADPNYEQSMQQQQIFTVLKTVADDEACLFNVRQRGLLPVVADVATNIGQVSSLMPTPNGFLLGAGGISIGSTLKIIIGLFKSPFDWRVANERKQFLDLNCSFFDLRRDVESAEIIDIRDRTLDEKIATAQAAQNKLLNYLNQITGERNSFSEQFNNLKQTHIRETLGQEHLDLISGISTIMNIYPNTGPIDEASKLKLIQAFNGEFPRIKSLAGNKENNPPYTDYIYELFDQFNWEDLSQNNEMNGQDFGHKFAHPLFHYLNAYKNHLQASVNQEDQNFLNYKLNPSERSNKELLDQAQKNYDEITFKLADALSRIGTRIKVLQSKDRKKSFDAYDEGAHATYDAIEQYRYIQSILTGKLGYNYMNYFRKHLKKENKRFQKSYKKFKKEYPSFQDENNKDFDIPWACRDANQLRIIWEDANSSAEVANDFVDTNMGIFFTDVRKVDTFLKFLPVGTASELKLLRYVKSADLAKKVLTGKEMYDKKAMRKFGFMRSKNLGELMFDLRNSEHQREEIEEFWKNRNCLVFL
ncbi:MAG: hypothetical protein HRU09_14545 [Oligoflexales bacterium]|nr:hypothetical protein [Oligoflexales bacterium]